MNRANRLRYLYFRFVRWNGESDYIDIIRDVGCYSPVGKIGGRQQLSLDWGCAGDIGTPIHELMHATGFKPPIILYFLTESILDFGYSIIDSFKF